MHSIQQGKAGWEQRASISLLQPGISGLMGQWHKHLEDFFTARGWLPHRCEEDCHSYYSYTLPFISCILTTEGKEQLDRNGFREKCVVPRIRKASRYIMLYQAIEECGFNVTDHTDQEPSPSLRRGLY